MRRMPGLRVLLLGGALVLVHAPGVFSQDPVRHGRDLLESGERKAARALLDSLLTAADSLTVPERSEAAYLRAVAEDNAEEYELRLRALLGDEVSGARRAWIYLSLGKISFAKGNLQQALQQFQKAGEEGRVEEGSLWEGLTAYALGDGSGARNALERVRDTGNDAIRRHALVILGNTYRAAGNLQEALSLYRQVREKETPGSGWWSAAALLEAEILEATDSPEQAVAPLREILAKAPGSYEAPMAWSRLRAITDRETGTTAETEPAASGAENGGPAGYAVQVGAFSFSDNAEGLAVHVRENGFPDARVDKGQDGLFRVLVGHLETRERAESLGDSLSTLLGLGFSVVQGN